MGPTGMLEVCAAPTDVLDAGAMTADELALPMTFS